MSQKGNTPNTPPKNEHRELERRDNNLSKIPHLFNYEVKPMSQTEVIINRQASTKSQPPCQQCQTQHTAKTPKQAQEHQDGKDHTRRPTHIPIKEKKISRTRKHQQHADLAQRPPRDPRKGQRRENTNISTETITKPYTRYKRNHQNTKARPM